MEWGSGQGEIKKTTVTGGSGGEATSPQGCVPAVHAEQPSASITVPAVQRRGTRAKKGAKNKKAGW
ncbi:hypothetical protein PM082_004636 [Marasmius tenuissimus]|nr:hypothetical protein PM082_004636 [Marasmius tenuissimus]